MKLRNKKTGEIIDIYKGEVTLHYKQGKKTIQFKSIEELEEWEDYEEPKEDWYIGDGGEVYGFSDYYLGTEIEETHRRIGNLFDTKEEAEKAVEKLKAWKRLKDIGLKPLSYYWSEGSNNLVIHYRLDYSKYDDRDLDLLFSGEDD